MMITSSIILSGFWESIVELTDFFIWPILAGIIVGILAPLIGSIIVIRRLSFIADTLSHFSLAGICFGVLLAQILSNTVLSGVSPVFMGIVFSVGGTFLIEHLRGFYSNYKELSMPIVMSLGAALTGIFIALSDGSAASNAMTLLFGSIFTVTLTDFIVILVMAALIFLFIAFYYRKIIALCFDETFARVSGIKAKALQLAITIILAVFISITMQMIGVLLVSALMIVPVAAGILIGKSFKNTCILSIVFSEISIIFGIYLSYVLSLPSGSVIVMINIFILILVMIGNHIYQKQKKVKKEKASIALANQNIIETDTSIEFTTNDVENEDSDNDSLDDSIKSKRQDE